MLPFNHWFLLQCPVSLNSGTATPVIQKSSGFNHCVTLQPQLLMNIRRGEFPVPLKFQERIKDVNYSLSVLGQGSKVRFSHFLLPTDGSTGDIAGSHHKVVHKHQAWSPEGHPQGASMLECLRWAHWARYRHRLHGAARGGFGQEAWIGKEVRSHSLESKYLLNKCLHLARCRGYRERLRW